MKVYDCFTFYNELDLLEIRLSELYDVVDYFVLVESKTMLNGTPKPLYYEENKHRFKKWNDKIIHVVAELPKMNMFDRMLIKLSRIGMLYKITGKVTALGFGRFRLEFSLRNQILTGLAKAKPNDIIMVSDLDEIPRRNVVSKAVALAKQGKYVGLAQTMYVFYLNGESTIPWVGTKICKREYLQKKLHNSPQYMRVPIYAMTAQRVFRKKVPLVVLKNSGWHFTHLGDAEKVIKKKQSGAHTEIVKKVDTDILTLKKEIDKGIFRVMNDVYYLKYVPVNKSFPGLLVSQKKKFSKLVRKV